MATAIPLNYGQYLKPPAGLSQAFMQAAKQSAPTFLTSGVDASALGPVGVAALPAAFAGTVGAASRYAGKAQQGNILNSWYGNTPAGLAAKEEMAKRNDVMGISRSASDAWRGNRLPSHWVDNSNAFPALATPADQKGTSWHPPNALAGEDAPVTDMPSALPFDDRYIKAARSDYDTRAKSINDILSPIQRDREEQLNNLRYGVGRDDSGLGQSGRAMKSALALNMIQGYEGDQAEMANARAKGIGALSPDSLTGTKFGMQNKELSEQGLFKESLPSAKGAIQEQQAKTKESTHKAALSDHIMNYVNAGKTPEEQQQRAIAMYGHAPKEDSTKNKAMADVMTSYAKGEIRPEHLTPELVAFFKSQGIFVPAPK